MKLILSVFICIVFNSCTINKTNILFQSDMESVFKKEFSQNQPGGSIIVKKGEKTVFLKSFGLANLETKETITENTVFNMGSISKTFVSNAILILKEKGFLSIEDSIYKYFPDFKNDQIAKKVKINHLLSHTSGLPDLRKVADNIDFYLTAKDKENFEPIKSVDSLNFDSGEKYQYSNPSYNGLALIIEKVTKQPWQNFIKENIFKPSGMTASKITNGSYPQDGVAHGYAYYDGAYHEYDYGEVPTFAAAGNGGVWSSILDLSKYELAIQNNIFLSKELTNESRSIFQPTNWNSSNDPVVGYSWFIDKKIFGVSNNFKVNFVYHTGSQGGFRAFYITIPEKDILFIGLFNRRFNDIGKLVFDGISILEKYGWLEE